MYLLRTQPDIVKSYPVIRRHGIDAARRYLAVKKYEAISRGDKIMRACLGFILGGVAAAMIVAMIKCWEII